MSLFLYYKYNNMTYNFPVVHPRSKIGRAYEIIDSLSGGKSTDDTQFSVRQVIRSIESAYAKSVREDVLYKQASGESISEQLFTEVFCESMEEYQEGDCLGADTCLTRRIKLPVLIQYKGTPLIKDVYVGQVLARSASNINSAKSHTRGRPFLPPTPAYFLSGGFLYVVLPEKMSRVCSVSYSAVLETITVGPEGCDNIWEEYPMIDYLWDSVKNQIRSGDGNAILNTTQVSDKINNGSPINQVS